MELYIIIAVLCVIVAGLLIAVLLLKRKVNNANNAPSTELIKQQKSELEDIKRQRQQVGEAMAEATNELRLMAQNNAIEREKIAADIDKLKKYKTELWNQCDDLEKTQQMKEDRVEELKDELANALRQKIQVNKKINEGNVANGVCLELSEWETNDLRILRDAAAQLHYKDLIEKIEYEYYYKVHMNELIKECAVSGVCGIYKISVEVDGRILSYIGQSVNIGDRWTQHLKRALGLDSAAAIKLYPAMRKYGIENFKWELVEKCDRSLLSEREIYWGNFYDVKGSGFNVKLG